MSFDRLAPHYTWMEKLLAGRRLQRCRLAWLETLAGGGDILVVGVGHGHFLRRCAQRFPDARITGVDASECMLRQARRRAQSAGVAMERLTFIHATLPDWTPPAAAFDAIVTHFFLDCFAPEELAEVIAVLAQAARPNAHWLVSDFAIPAAGFARKRARLVHMLMYAFFRSATNITARAVTDPDTLLDREGFRLAGRITMEWGLLQSDRWERAAA